MIFKVCEAARTAPGISIRAVILSDCGLVSNWLIMGGMSQGVPRLSHACRPLSLSNVRTPFLPVLGTVAILLEASLFLSEVLVAVMNNHGAI